MKTITKLRFVLLCLIFSLLYGCQSTVPKEQIAENWHNHQQDLKQINAFQVRGSIAIIGQSSKSYSRFLLDQPSVAHYEIKLTTPVGSTIATLTSQPNYSQLIDRNGKQYVDQNVENLMYRVTHINIPFNSLHNWLKGLSDNPNSDKLDNLGRLSSTELIQNSNQWKLKITSYKKVQFKKLHKEVDLPTIIELTNNEDKIRLKIDNWRLP